MDRIERRQHELHAELPAFQRKLDWTRDVIREAMSKDVRWYLAFSGGADSTVLLDLVLEQADRRIPVLWGDDGFDFPETIAFFDTIEERYHFDDIFIDDGIFHIRCLAPWREWCIEMDRPDLASDPAALDVWGNPQNWWATWDSLKDARDHGYDGVFLGLLARESKQRSYALRGGYKPLYQVKSEGGMWHCSPLASWTKRDIWAYLISRNVPYNPVYDRLAELGVPLEQRRCAPLTCYRVLQYGSHAILKAGWPDLYTHLAATFPRLRSFS